MRRRNIYLVCLVVVVGLFYAKSGAVSRDGVPSVSGAEGQIFVVRLIPAADRLEVLVTGKKVAGVEFSQIDLTAQLNIGNRWIVIPAKRRSDRFELEALPSRSADSTLKIRLKSQLEVENFEFKVPASQP